MIAAATAALAAATRLFSGLRKREPKPPSRPEFVRFRFCLERRPSLDGVTQTMLVGDTGKAVENG